MKEHDEKMAELEIKELKEKAGITKNVRQMNLMTSSVKNGSSGL